MDRTRVYDGFAELSRGMDGGRDASLILPSQVAACVNGTFRGDLLKTRPPFWKLNLQFESAETRERFDGKFQGALFYESDTPAHILSVGGRLFRVETDDTNLVTEITPKLTIVVTEDFTVPGVGLTVMVDVTSEASFTIGQLLTIDSGSYTVTNRFANALLLTYNGGAANATVLSGAGIIDSATGLAITEVRQNPSTLDFVHLFQAENYVIVLAGQQKPVIYDGSSVRLAGINEVPPGILGFYVWGRIWIVLNDGRSFVAGDLIHTTILTDASDILRFTENTFLNEGGTFGVPYSAGRITGMQALATQDTSLGQGNLLVATRNTVFSVNTPVDRDQWKNVRYPIQTVSLIDYGIEGPRAGTTVNGDWWYRSIDGWRSFITARRDIQVWGNTPMSREIDPVTEQESDELLFFASAILFDNRLLATAVPFVSDIGIAHEGLSVLNFDLVSNIQGKTIPAWDGAWSGIHILQLTKGNVLRKERGYAWVANEHCIELWELQKAKAGVYDQTIEFIDNEEIISRSPIEGSIVSRQMDFRSPDNLKELRMGDLRLMDLRDNVTIVIKWRPDEYPNWSTWATLQFCASTGQCTFQASEGVNCRVWKPNAPLYAARVLLPNPPEECNEVAGIPLHRGYEFQFRIEWTGSVTFKRFKPHANIVPDDMEGGCPPEVECKALEACGDAWFEYDAMPECS